VHFVSIDSSCAIGLTGPCDRNRQLAWVEDDLAGSQQPWKIAFFHHPPWSSGEHGSQLTMRRDYGPLFEAHGVDLVLTGHDHNYERSLPMTGDVVAPPGTRGVVYVVVGSGGAGQRAFPGPQPGWTAFRDNLFGYLSVRADNTSLRAQFIDTAGIARDSFAIDQSAKKTSKVGKAAFARMQSHR
jgi:acid phosphatase type 7